MNDVMIQEDRRNTIAPAARVREDEGQVIVTIEMPGVQKRDLGIEVKGQELTVTGRRQKSTLEGTWILRECRQGDFRKTYSVDDSIDLEKVEAELSNGILTLSLPMKEAAKPRRIEIHTN